MADGDSARLVELIYQRIERDYPFPPVLQERWDAALDAAVAANDEAVADAGLDALVAEEPEMEAILQQRALVTESVLALIDSGAEYDPETDSWVEGLTE
jgi:hypothetical protein